MTEKPLNDWEIKVLRGLVDEHNYRMARNRFLRAFPLRTLAIIGAIGAVVVVVLNIVQLIVVIYRR